MGGTIICGVTERPDGRNAAELARALGARLDLRLVLVYVVEGVVPGTEEGMSSRQRQTGAQRTLDEIARDIGNGTEKRVVLGDRAEVLARIAADEGADLIVLGSRAAGLGSRNLRCALARRLESATPVPVLVAPPSTRKHSDHRLSATVDAVGR
jgi:nucleotide-binding universal stress UspA family protein